MDGLRDYLASTEIVDWRNPRVLAKARELAEADAVETARRCFTFVRDEIHHSWDYQQDPVTCNASDVLAEGTGYCYAKSHLLAALLRATGIPAGLSYQRLCQDRGHQGFDPCARPGGRRFGGRDRAASAALPRQGARKT